MLTGTLVPDGECRPPVIVGANGAATFPKLLFAMVLMAALVAPVAARAAESNRLVSHEDTVSISDSASGPTLGLGLLFRLSKGWHIYWKNAGGTGSPPQLALTQPAHVTTGAFAWPAPDWLVAQESSPFASTISTEGLRGATGSAR
jgi:DsbC/DsbD-like thiol-disulfide interchange protein